MQRTKIGFTTLMASVLLAAGCAATTMAGDKNGFEAFVEIENSMEFTGEMIIRPIQESQGVDFGYDADTINAMRDNAVQAIHANTEVLEYVWQTDEYIIQLPEGVTETELAQQFMESGLFDYAEPNWLVFPTVIPNDSRLGSQWHHKSPTVNSYGGWDMHTGNSSVSVGICDTGVRTTHEDLLLHRLEGYNAVDRRWENAGGQISDINGHGTWCTGTAAANGNNGKGVSGMGWNLSHRMLRVTNSGGGGAYIADLAHAARTSADAGDRVSSVSYGGATSSTARSAATYCKSRGALCFWAAGNEGSYLSGNRDSDDLLVIGSTTSSDSKSSFSNYGPYVDFMAGGSNIYTTDRGSNSSYGAVSGTSFACPMAAGLATLIWSADSSLTPDEVEQLLKDTCTDLGSSGVDDTFGYGRIDSKDALDTIGTFQLSFEPALPLRGGQTTDFVLTNGTPNETTGMYYSLRGEGLTEVAPGLFVDLKKAKQIGNNKNTAGNGNVFWSVKIPNAGSGRRVFLQAIQNDGNKTEMIYTDIE